MNSTDTISQVLYELRRRKLIPTFLSRLEPTVYYDSAQLLPLAKESRLSTLKIGDLSTLSLRYRVLGGTREFDLPCTPFGFDLYFFFLATRSILHESQTNPATTSKSRHKGFPSDHPERQ